MVQIPLGNFVFLGRVLLAETRTKPGGPLSPKLGVDAGFVWRRTRYRDLAFFERASLEPDVWWVWFSVTGSFGFVGNVIGKKGSKRVLLRRLAIVFTVFLAAASVQNLSFSQPWFILLSAALYVWATVLGFYAIREQFSLNSLETAIVSVLAALVVSASLHVTDHAAKLVAGVESDRPAITGS
ncbi:MAG: hypothetical protein R3B54_08330 [Bdellovibrionota bacterium]